RRRRAPRRSGGRPGPRARRAPGPRPAAPPRERGHGGGVPAVASAWRASPPALSSSPFRPGGRKHRRPQGSRSPTASRGTSWRERDGGLGQRGGGLEGGVAGPGRGGGIGARGGGPGARAAAFRAGRGGGEKSSLGESALAAGAQE